MLSVAARYEFKPVNGMVYYNAQEQAPERMLNEKFCPANLHRNDTLSYCKTLKQFQDKSLIISYKINYLQLLHLINLLCK